MYFCLMSCGPSEEGHSKEKSLNRILFWSRQDGSSLAFQDRSLFYKQYSWQEFWSIDVSLKEASEHLFFGGKPEYNLPSARLVHVGSFSSDKWPVRTKNLALANLTWLELIAVDCTMWSWEAAGSGHVEFGNIGSMVKQSQLRKRPCSPIILCSSDRSGRGVTGLSQSKLPVRCLLL